MMHPRTEREKRILGSLLGLPLDERALAYLERRGLKSVATDLGFGVVPASAGRNLQRYVGRLVIPSIGPTENVYDVAFRCLEHDDCKGTVLYVTDEGKAISCRKYLFLPDIPARLYNLRALARAGSVLDIAEGQLDAATLEACGLHAVGVPGVDGWKEHHRRLFQGFDRIRVWGDGDVAGKKFANKIRHEVANAEVMMVPSGYDVNSLYVEQGRERILSIAEGDTEDETDDAGWGTGVVAPEPIPF